MFRLLVFSFILFYELVLASHFQKYFKPLSISLTDAEESWINSLFYKHTPGAPLRRRNEIRHLTKMERNTLFLAMIKLKNDDSNGEIVPSKYDLLVQIYRSSLGKAGHNGPSFLGFHRVYLLMFENALRQIEPTVALAYWDPSVDDDSSAKSVLFSDIFFGNGEGPVTTGLFADWFSPEGKIIQRNVGDMGRLTSTFDIKYVLNQRSLTDISRPSAPTFRSIEDLHRRMTQWVGGDMADLETAALDPVFIFVTAFFDKLWEAFRRQQFARGMNPSYDYPYQETLNTLHSASSPMNLGSMLNVDGVQNFYTEQIYTYTHIPDGRCIPNVYGCRHSNRVCVRNRCVLSGVNNVRSRFPVMVSRRAAKVRRHVYNPRTGYWHIFY